MSETLKRIISAAMPIAVPQQRELVVVSPPPPTLADLAAEINADYAEITRAALTAVEKAINIGKRLNEAKDKLNHGEFGGYITSNFPFTMRWGQQCMKLANHEAEVRQRLEELRSISSHLSLAEAFKLIGSLNPRPKPKRRKLKAAT
ncbi:MULTISPECIES: DUF3102 domain-containing protein [Bradyrhizobium]|uniref:Uncharacterized protein n=1 Tax=Bradyrhizobium diazoefficiens TaxID=1355477 RepID=A0A810A9J7_9BRAD|nr:DUF3102 domain-containing protein [Bradyrhizobium diazoefficiens]MBP1060763.1 hypothetical protein [Bradyrhizobium japonicum]AWO87695.2 DUF3102 domain-containing protein [Bradyrhizobium diazoefficiens]BBZ90744.1 hypothetical protein F07S3_05770 [Bradyrhizobium diazoefficiens]BCA08730.1 hypothetical protein BDHF08_05770 [Bradyrhizobium diazoefficiens]BCE53066.1 hypothetical protein XF5B_05780 [Bradyrhizobium diazoefficiens]